MSRVSAPAASDSGERFTEQQLVEILRRAAERQEGLTADTDGRFSLAEIQQIASEVGIGPAHVAEAAAELETRRLPPRDGVLGAPTVFRFERWLDGEIPRDGIGELFDIARGETELQGTVTEVLDTVEWRGRGHIGALAIGSSLAVAGAGALALAGVAAVSLTWAGMGSWLAMRGIWRRVARNWAPRARALGTRLVAAAQQAIDAARKSTE